MNACHLPSELLIEISSYLSWTDLAAWVLINREHAARLSPILYQSLQPYDYRSSKALRGGGNDPSAVKPRSGIINWAAGRGLIGTIEKVSAIEDIKPFIDYPILRNGHNGLKSFGMTPMHQAALCGQASVIDFLVEWGANVDTTIAGGLRPIHFAGNEAVVQSLVRHGSSPHSSGPSCISPLAHAISTNTAPNTVKCFLKLGCDPNIVTPMAYSAGEEAVRTARDDILEILLEGGLDVSEAAPRGGSLIYKAIYYLQKSRPDKALDIIKLLLKYGASAHGGSTTVDGPWQLHLLQTNLYLAASLPGSSTIVQLLLDHGADANTKSWVWDTSIDPETPLKRLILIASSSSEAVADANIETITILVKHGAKFDQLNGESPLFNRLLSVRPLRPGLVKIVTYLVDPNAHLTSEEAKTSIKIRFLHRAGPVHIFLSNIAWFQRNRYVNQVGSYKLLKALLRLGADCNEPDSHGDAPLILACRLPEEANGLKIIKALKAHGANMGVVSERGLGALHTIIGLRSIVTIECANRYQAILMAEGGGKIDVEARDRRGMTALATLADMRPERHEKHDLKRYPIAIKRRMMVMLLRCGADIHAKQTPHPDNPAPPGSVADIYCFLGGTPLHFACRNRYPEIVQLLLEHGADVNGQTDKGYTPLMALIIAAAEVFLGWKEIVNMAKMLLDAGADPKIKNSNGETAWDIWVTRTSIPDVFMPFGGQHGGDFNVRVGKGLIQEICGVSLVDEQMDTT